MPPSHSKIRFGILVLSILLLTTLSARVIKGPFTNSQPIKLTSPKFEISSNFRFVYKSERLSKIIQNNIGGMEGEYGVYIEDLSDKENYGLNHNDIFPAASIYKLYLMAAVLKEVEDQRLNIQDQISSNKIYLTNKLGSVDFGYEDSPATISYTVDEALTRIGRISDNFASIMLAEKIGWDKLQQVADSLGSASTEFTDPITTTALDTALFFRKLYLKEVVSPQVSEGVTKYLKLNQLSDRIPAFLGEDAEVIHKTGELAGVRHDAGIVYLVGPTSAGRAYLIVLMSRDLKYEDEGVETLANISKEVYEYFKNKYQ